MENFKLNVVLLIDQKTFYYRGCTKEDEALKEKLNDLEALINKYYKQFKSLPQINTRFIIDDYEGDCWSIYAIHVTGKEIEICLEN